MKPVRCNPVPASVLWIGQVPEGDEAKADGTRPNGPIGRNTSMCTGFEWYSAGKLIDVKDDINLEQQAIYVFLCDSEKMSQIVLLRSSGLVWISQATQCDALKTVPFFSDPSDAMHEFAGDSDTVRDWCLFTLKMHLLNGSLVSFGPLTRTVSFFQNTLVFVGAVGWAWDVCSVAPFFRKKSTRKWI